MTIKPKRNSSVPVTREELAAHLRQLRTQLLELNVKIAYGDLPARDPFAFQTLQAGYRNEGEKEKLESQIAAAEKALKLWAELEMEL